MEHTPPTPSPEVLAAHRHSARHREELGRSEICGCFCCCRVFAPSEIHEWVDDDQTAICPHCGIDAVIGSASEYPINAGFLAMMGSYWFGRECAASGVIRDVHRCFGEDLRAQPHPLLFATLSGAHLYGFPSADSDYDLRGAHILPARNMLGLSVRDETIEWSGLRDGREIDLVTHDVRKFFLLLLKPNGYVLEQLYSPLVVRTTPEHEELKDIARGCITRNHAHHYLGFARTQWALFEKDRRVKPLLYTYRVLLAGIHLMRTGQVEANLLRLKTEFRGLELDALIQRKVGGTEDTPLGDADIALRERECRRLTAKLEEARDASNLPPAPTARTALEDLLVRLRGVGA